MPIPKYNQMYKLFLEAIKDGSTYTIKQVKDIIAKKLSITDAERLELLPSGLQSVFDNRIGWTRTYLKKAELIDSPARATFVITDRGKRVIAENPTIIDDKYLMQFNSFKNFIKPSSNAQTLVEAETSSDSPADAFEKSFVQINAQLADEILSEIIKLSPTAFEQMAIDLLYKMGYGAFENAGTTTTKSGDEGIDGIIREDKLGFNLIYIQAKKWNLSSTVGRPEVQKFVGATSGKGGKGLFITTAKFTKEAIDYAKNQHIVLIDGEKLAKLMIEHDFGVTPKKVFEIKTIDTDMFNEYEE